MLGKGFGGAERSFVDLCRALCERGHDVLALCESRAQAREHLRSIPGLSLEEVTVRGSWDIFARRTIRKSLVQYGPSIVQLHLARAAAVAGPAARSLGIPTLAKTHNYVNLKYYHSVDHLVATTEKQQRYLLDQGIEPAHTTIIPNFSALVPDAPLTDRDSARLRVVAVGRMVHKKGFDVLFEALAFAIEQGCAIELRLAGDGPESDALHDQINRLGIAGAVTFLGWRDDVQSILREADVFILPSRDEPFGIVCLEAMACGIPIIATRTDGPSTFLDETTALMVPVADAGALARALVTVAGDRESAHARAGTARSRFEAHYSEAIVVGRYLKLYDQLITASPGSH